MSMATNSTTTPPIKGQTWRNDKTRTAARVIELGKPWNRSSRGEPTVVLWDGGGKEHSIPLANFPGNWRLVRDEDGQRVGPGEEA